MSKVENLAIDLLRTNGGTQMRAELTQDVYLDYRDKWLAGIEFNPLDVFYDGATYWLADGFHRFYGAREAKRGSVPCRIHQGTQRDAIDFACGANASHGLRRTNEDKQNAVKAQLNDEEWVLLTDNAIAKKCHVTQPFVSEVRSQLITVINSPAAKTADAPKKGRDGKSYKPRKTSTKRKSKPASASGGTSTSTDATPNLPTEGTANQAEPGSQGTGGAAGVDLEAIDVDVCPKGGEHEWDADGICMKCADQGPQSFLGKSTDQRALVESFARRVMSAFTDEVPIDPWLDDDRLNIAKDQIKSACATIRLAKAHDKPCPKCGGAGCKTCRNCGYLPKLSYQAAGGQ